MTETWKDRVRAEHAELVGRIERLEVFLHSSAAEALDEDGRSLLRVQLWAMRSYEETLALRISRF